MKNSFDFNSIHFIGILGASMSNLAVFAKKLGLIVSGSDKRSDENKFILERNGICFYQGSNPNIAVKSDLIVYSSAVSHSDDELSFCIKMGKLCISRAEFLALLCKKFKRVIAISGTHGKSTVTAMTGKIFSDAGLSPFVHVGAKTTIRECNFDYAIVEACEYKKSFLCLSPDISVVLNIESDHPDCYNSIDELNKTFTDFTNRTKETGIVVCSQDLSLTSNRKTYKVGRDAYAINVRHNNGFYSFTPIILGKKYPDVTLSIRGEHNITNALFALLLSAIEKITPTIAVKSISNFQGIDRRYQSFGKINGGEVILDYAHHPTEIIATIKTAKLYSNHVVVYFQPHTYSRTAKLFDEFTKAFDLADELIIVEEYPARESPSMGKSAKELYHAIFAERNCKYASLSSAKEYLHTQNNENKTILVLGAGNINSILS